MINTEMHDHFGEELEFVEIDLRTSKHKNRLVEILEKRNQLTGEFEYDIQAKWTQPKFHPNMTMTEDELLELSAVINGWVEKIKTARELRDQSEGE
ncbi:hypothetical protein [Pseudomonas rubra]|uniref:Uncharacterized protein n=1 Tax=Pseudomonas rubra TaxID=2942627 RepID=A0ABT5PEW5_9PSED|nr:hypothetical protein [Pseudomonas rubra]MDD1016860.1 hypothetical protein [Pseudomonas rubra]MDD1039394.1 hypothetical protein [Pseudomonas rubra]MDD1157824.1 hypothetical protein [Pseudomonas rubra]